MGMVQTRMGMRGQTNESILEPGLQRRLRNGATDAEQRLWGILRNRQLAGFKFRRQHPYYHCILDFVCLEHKLVIEADGGQHADSDADQARDRFLQDGGFTVLRFWNNEILENTTGVADVILQVLDIKTAPSPPNPPLEGEG